jgi:hypothetical protein
VGEHGQELVNAPIRQYGYDQHRDILSGRVTLQALQERPRALSFQHDVEQNGSRAQIAQDAVGIGSGARRHDLEPRRGQIPLVHENGLAVILHHEHGRAVRIDLPRLNVGQLAGVRMHDGHAQRERRTTTELALHRQDATQNLGQAARQRSAHPALNTVLRGAKCSAR